MSGQRQGAGFLGGAVFGVLFTAAFWFGPDALALFRQLHEPAATPQPVIREPLPAPAAPPAEIAAPPAAKPSSTVPPEDTAAALASLTRTCTFWTARATDSAGRLYRDRACRQMREYAERNGQRAPLVSAVPSSAVPQPSPRNQAVVPRAIVNECTRHERGSISYRKCRALESQRLKNLCQVHRQRDEWQLAGEWCAAYEHYPIVD